MQRVKITWKIIMVTGSSTINWIISQFSNQIFLLRSKTIKHVNLRKSVSIIISICESKFNKKNEQGVDYSSYRMNNKTAGAGILIYFM